MRIRAAGVEWIIEIDKDGTFRSFAIKSVDGKPEIGTGAWEKIDNRKANVVFGVVRTKAPPPELLNIELLDNDTFELKNASGNEKLKFKRQK